MAFTYRIHEKAGMKILAVADSNIIGSVISSGNVKVEVNEKFYGTGKAGREEILGIVRDSLKDGAHINILGNNIIALLVKESIIKPDSVLDIAGTRHAQIYSLGS